MRYFRRVIGKSCFSPGTKCLVSVWFSANEFDALIDSLRKEDKD